MSACPSGAHMMRMWMGVWPAARAHLGGVLGIQQQQLADDGVGAEIVHLHGSRRAGWRGCEAFIPTCPAVGASLWLPGCFACWLRGTAALARCKRHGM